MSVTMEDRLKYMEEFQVNSVEGMHAWAYVFHSSGF